MEAPLITKWGGVSFKFPRIKIFGNRKKELVLLLSDNKTKEEFIPLISELKDCSGMA